MSLFNVTILCRFYCAQCSSDCCRSCAVGDPPASPEPVRTAVSSRQPRPICKPPMEATLHDAKGHKMKWAPEAAKGSYAWQCDICERLAMQAGTGDGHCRYFCKVCKSDICARCSEAYYVLSAPKSPEERHRDRVVAAALLRQSVASDQSSRNVLDNVISALSASLIAISKHLRGRAQSNSHASWSGASQCMEAAKKYYLLERNSPGSKFNYLAIANEYFTAGQLYCKAAVAALSRCKDWAKKEYELRQAAIIMVGKHIALRKNIIAAQEMGCARVMADCLPILAQLGTAVKIHVAVAKGAASSSADAAILVRSAQEMIKALGCRDAGGRIDRHRIVALNELTRQIRSLRDKVSRVMKCSALSNKAAILSRYSEAIGDLETAQALYTTYRANCNSHCKSAMYDALASKARCTGLRGLLRGRATDDLVAGRQSHGALQTSISDLSKAMAYHQEAVDAIESSTVRSMCSFKSALGRSYYHRCALQAIWLFHEPDAHALLSCAVSELNFIRSHCESVELCVNHALKYLSAQHYDWSMVNLNNADLLCMAVSTYATLLETQVFAAFNGDAEQGASIKDESLSRSKALVERAMKLATSANDDVVGTVLHSECVTQRWRCDILTHQNAGRTQQLRVLENLGTLQKEAEDAFAAYKDNVGKRGESNLWKLAILKAEVFGRSFSNASPDIPSCLRQLNESAIQSLRSAMSHYTTAYSSFLKAEAENERFMGLDSTLRRWTQVHDHNGYMRREEMIRQAESTCRVRDNALAAAEKAFWTGDLVRMKAKCTGCANECQSRNCMGLMRRFIQVGDTVGSSEASLKAAEEAMDAVWKIIAEGAHE